MKSYRLHILNTHKGIFSFCTLYKCPMQIKNDRLNMLNIHKSIFSSCARVQCVQYINTNKKLQVHHINPLMAIGNNSFQFLICCPRDCVSRHNGGTSGAPLKPLRVDSTLRTLSTLRGLRGAPKCPHYAERRSLSDSK